MLENQNQMRDHRKQKSYLRIVFATKARVLFVKTVCPNQSTEINIQPNWCSCQSLDMQQPLFMHCIAINKRFERGHWIARMAQGCSYGTESRNPLQLVEFDFTWFTQIPCMKQMFLNAPQKRTRKHRHFGKRCNSRFASLTRTLSSAGCIDSMACFYGLVWHRR